jgi:FtsH-binding integral membrane protein
MNFIDTRTGQVSKFLVDANFYLSLLLLLYGGFTGITENHAIFEFNDDLYGAMHNNLRIALLYLAMTEVVICLFCLFTKQPKMMLFVGCFLLMMLGSLSVYGKVNTVPIDSNLPLFFLYTGISHVLFGFIASLPKANSKQVFNK